MISCSFLLYENLEIFRSLSVTLFMHYSYGLADAQIDTSIIDMKLAWNSCCGDI